MKLENSNPSDILYERCISFACANKVTKYILKSYASRDSIIKGSPAILAGIKMYSYVCVECKSTIFRSRSF